MTSQIYSKKLNRVFEDIDKAIYNSYIPSAVLGFIDINKNKIIKSKGYRQLIPSKKLVNSQTIFDLASLTKVIFTTHQILQLNSKNLIDLNAPIEEYLPDLSQYDYSSWERKVTIKECLSHSTPFPAVEPIYTRGNDPHTLKAYILQKRWKKNLPVYSDINFILLGFILERLLKKNITNIKSGYNFNFKPKGNNIAATEMCHWRNKIMVGQTHDENSFALKGAGHAGVFGKADDLLLFAHDMLISKNISDQHQQLIQTKVFKNRTYGWEIAHKNWSGGNNCSNKTIGHTGFTGTGLWIDFKNNYAWTLLTNRVHPSRHKDSKITSLRIKIGDKINQEFGTK
jgi:CubicO group peptidase (beta-lactamase class C family)